MSKDRHKRNIIFYSHPNNYQKLQLEKTDKTDSFDYWAFYMNFGVERRSKIIEFLKLQHTFYGETNRIYVNNKHQLNIKIDKDLQYLLKKKKIKLLREKSCGHKRSSFVILNT